MKAKTQKRKILNQKQMQQKDAAYSVNTAEVLQTLHCGQCRMLVCSQCHGATTHVFDIETAIHHVEVKVLFAPLLK